MVRRRQLPQDFADPMYFSAEENRALAALQEEMRRSERPSPEFIQQHKQNLFRPLTNLMGQGNVETRVRAMRYLVGVTNQIRYSLPTTEFCKNTLDFYVRNMDEILNPLALAVVGGEDRIAGEALAALVDMTHNISKPEIGYQLREGVPADKVKLTSEKALLKASTALHGVAGVSRVLEGTRDIDKSRADVVDRLNSELTTALYEAVPEQDYLKRKVDAASSDGERKYYTELLKFRQRIERM
jgi:hypothetical protein